MITSTCLPKLYATMRAMRPNDPKDKRQPFTIFTWIDRLASLGKTTQSVLSQFSSQGKAIFTTEQWERNLSAIGRPLSKKLKPHPTDDDPDPATRKTGERKHGFAFIQWQENRPMLPAFYKS